MTKNKGKSQRQQQAGKPVKANTSVFGKNRKGILLSLIIVFSLPVVLYLQTIAYGYTYFDDDLIILNNIPFLSDFGNAPRAFITNQFITKPSSFYRPMGTLSYMVDMQLSGGNNAWMYHLSNIVLSGFFACSLFLLLKRFSIPINLALFGTLIYCMHPLFVSTTAFIPNRVELLVLLFSLLSFLFFIEFLQKKKTIYLCIHWAAYTVALFCKETAAFLPFLFILYYLIFTFKNSFEKKYLVPLLLYGGSGLFWFCLRSITFHNRSIQGDEFGLTALLHNLRNIPESLAKFFLPSDSAPIPSYSLFNTVAGLGIIIMLIIVFFKSGERSKKEKIFCFSWFLILLVPSMLFKNQHYDYLDHRFSLPLIGILFYLLFIIPPRWFEKGDVKKYCMMIALVLFLSYFSLVKSHAYSNPLTFYSTAISQNPHSDFAYNNRGAYYLSRGLYDKAIADFSKAIEINPYYKVYYNRGSAYDAQELYDKAIADYTKAIELKPDDTETYNNRGITYYHQGIYDKAIVDYTKAIELKPDDADAYYNRGIACHHQGLLDKAMSDYTKAIELKPDYAEVYNNRGMIYLHQGSTDKSCRDFKKAGELGITTANDYFTKYCK
jgi:tetratricopeptide (TPR) repeat protein